MDNQYIDQQVGQRVALAREARHLSQRAFAALLGWPHGTLANYENGRRPLTIAHLCHIAHILECSPASFLVASSTAALVCDRIANDEMLAHQVAYFLNALDDPLPEPQP